MKISASCNGGFTGITEHYELDTACVPDGPRLEALLHQLAQAAPSPAPLGSDLARWLITFEHGGARRTVAVVDAGDAAVCPDFQSLLARLRASR